MNKIYVILDNSHEWDDIESFQKIIMMTTDFESAKSFFEHNYSDTPQKDNTKWCYEYELWEYNDGYNYYSTFSSNDKQRKLLINTNNIGD